MPATLEFEQVLWAPRGVPLLKNLTATFTPGSVTAVVGPNGAGKSSFLKAAAGFLNIKQGRILWKGKEQRFFGHRQAANFRHWCGSEDEDGLTVRSVVEAGVYPLAGRWQSLTEAQLQRLKELGTTLEVLLDWNDPRAFRSFSSGERRLVHLIRTFLLPAELYLLDEPGAPLDLRHRLLLGNLLRQTAAQGATLLVSYHDLAEALSVADHVIVLEHGQVKIHGSVKELTPELIKSVWRVQSPETGWTWASLETKT